MNKQLSDLELSFKKRYNGSEQKYYFELCCPTIIELYSECPESMIGIIIKKCFKIDDTFFNVISVTIDYVNLTIGFGNSFTQLIDESNVLRLYTDNIIKQNKICIKKYILHVQPKCLTLTDTKIIKGRVIDITSFFNLLSFALESTISNASYEEIKSILTNLFKSLNINLKLILNLKNINDEGLNTFLNKIQNLSSVDATTLSDEVKRSLEKIFSELLASTSILQNILDSSGSGSGSGSGSPLTELEEIISNEISNDIILVIKNMIDSIVGNSTAAQSDKNYLYLLTYFIIMYKNQLGEPIEDTKDYFYNIWSDITNALISTDNVSNIIDKLNTGIQQESDSIIKITIQYLLNWDDFKNNNLNSISQYLSNNNGELVEQIINKFSSGSSGSSGRSYIESKYNNDYKTVKALTFLALVKKGNLTWPTTKNELLSLFDEVNVDDITTNIWTEYITQDMIDFLNDSTNEININELVNTMISIYLSNLSQNTIYRSIEDIINEMIENGYFDNTPILPEFESSGMRYINANYISYIKLVQWLTYYIMAYNNKLSDEWPTTKTKLFSYFENIINLDIEGNFAEDQGHIDSLYTWDQIINENTITNINNDIFILTDSTDRFDLLNIIDSYKNDTTTVQTTSLTNFIINTLTDTFPNLPDLPQD